MSKTASRIVRMIAYVMSIVLLLYFVPSQGLSVLANAEYLPDVSQEVSSAEENTTEESVAKVIGEDVSLREENIKHFIMSDHTYRAVVYSTPVHYQKDGDWVDIDNTLTAQATLSEDDFPGQITTDGPFKVKFANNVIRTSGPDDKYNTEDDILTVCQFDNAGRLVSSQAKTAGGNSIGATVAQYTDTSTATVSSLNQQNRVLNSASFGRNTTDWITNTNFESNLSGWTESETDASASYDVSSDEAYFGKKSAKISVSAVTAQTGRATLIQDISGLNSGSTYTYSVYIKTESLNKVYEGTHDGAFIRLLTQDSAETFGVYSECIAENTDEAFDNGWRRLTATITLPSDCTKLRAYIQLRNMTGTMYADGAQLEKGEYAHPVNLLENSGFEKSSSGLPTSWTASGFSYSAASDGTVLEGVTTAYKHDGSRSVRMAGDAGTDKYLSQTIPVSGNPLETYIVSGWANGRAISSINHQVKNEEDEWEDTVFFEIAISVKYKKSDGSYRNETRPAAKFNHTISGWQYTAQTFSLVSTENADDTPVSITIKVRYTKQANSVYFDHLQVLRDNANSYTYDEDGNMVSVSANAEQESKMEYDGSDLLSVSDNLGYAYEYSYDSWHNVSFGQSAGDVFTVYDRDFGTGQILGVSVENSNGTLEILENISYTGDVGSINAGAHVASTTDQHGRITTYSYDAYGRNSTITTPDGVSTKYTYTSTSSTRISKIQAIDTENNNAVLGSVSYTYDGDRLKTLSYGQDTYTFNVDRFGNATSTTINGKPLSTNAYAAKNGKLQSVTYGNGDVRTYSYNWLGQTLAIGNGTNAMYRYTYDLNGKLLEFIDNMASRKTTYVQDSINRPVREKHETKSGTFLGMVEYGYDERDNLKKLAVNWGGHTHVAEYLYKAISGRSETQRYEKDNLPTRYKYLSTRYADYSYDAINRLTSRTFSTATPLTNTYTYYSSAERNVDGFTCYQTNQLHTETINGVTYEYTYDVAGNITLIKKGTGNNLVDYRRYTYDALSQLTSETFYDANGTATKTVSYDYDGYGNITGRNVTHTNGGGATAEFFGYDTDSDAGWSKLLTEYNGQNIDYDAIGNPISYHGATLTWGNGRELRGYVGGGNTIVYTYDDTGLRTSKTVNGAKSTYLYVSGQLQGEVRDGHHIHYSYDSYGNLSVIKYYTNDTDYHLFYVMTNAQGDVVSLHNANGTMKVSYEYDAWGNLVNMTDTTDIGIGTINPFRYRGYYYDAETGLYYLTSRYYDPEVGRFINADSYAATGQGVLGHNGFAYCGNNPVIRADQGGQFWDIFFDVVSLVISVVDVVKNPSSGAAWAGLAADVACLVVPGVTGGGSMVRAAAKVDDVIDTAKTVNRIDNAVDVAKSVKAVDNSVNTAKSVKKVHGNSLKTTKETIGYALKKNGTGEIMKFGETTQGVKRYTKKFYTENDVSMEQLARGTKYEMHYWQHDQIINYVEKYGHRPPWNKSDW